MSGWASRAPQSLNANNGFPNFQTKYSWYYQRLKFNEIHIFKLAPSALACVGLLLDPEGKHMASSLQNLFVLRIRNFLYKYRDFKKLKMPIYFDQVLLDNFCCHFCNKKRYNKKKTNPIKIFFILIRFKDLQENYKYP